ncbi:GtrA family protein [Sphingomonas sp.]|uniref:GtrA family protein n=1 Tax=Sphingomonas sp. TaxID=28214 RepID=UPI003CC5C385
MTAPDPPADPVIATVPPAGLLARLRTRDGRTSLRFVAAGGLNTAVGLAAYPVLYAVLHVQKYGALGIAQASCLVFAFTTYKLVVFRTRGNILAEFVRFASFYLVNYAANWAALPFMVEVLRWNPILSQLGFTGAVIVGSYFWHSRVTFKPRPSLFGDAAAAAREEDDTACRP